LPLEEKQTLAYWALSFWNKELELVSPACKNAHKNFC